MIQNIKYNITVSVVLYNTKEEELKKSVLSLLKTKLNIKLFLVDKFRPFFKCNVHLFFVYQNHI